MLRRTSNPGLKSAYRVYRDSKRTVECISYRFCAGTMSERQWKIGYRQADVELLCAKECTGCVLAGDLKGLNDRPKGYERQRLWRQRLLRWKKRG